MQNFHMRWDYCSGYPVEDVEGFIENKGHNYLYAGYWKVYGHVEEKKALFNRYEEARKVLIQLLASGRSVRARWLPVMLNFYL